MRTALDKSEVIEACKQYVSRMYLRDDKYGMNDFKCNLDDIYISDIYGLVFREVEDDSKRDN
jgi:hypothetical protein